MRFIKADKGILFKIEIIFLTSFGQIVGAGFSDNVESLDTKNRVFQPPFEQAFHPAHPHDAAVLETQG